MTQTSTSLRAAPTGAPSAPPPSAATSAGVRSAWWILGAVMLLGMLSWGTYNVVTLIAHEEYTEVTRFDPEGIGVLDVSSVNGRVTVVGDAAAEEIVVTADVSDGLRPTGNRQEVVGDRLELAGSCPVLGSAWCSVDYTVELPSALAVFAAADNGRLRVSGIEGPVDVNSDNGSVEVDDVSGKLTLDNDNGRITATGISSEAVSADSDNGSVALTFTEAPQSVRATSDNGDVEVVLPDGEEAYRLDIATDNGSIVDPIRTDPASERVIVIETDNGDVTARYGS